MEPTDTELTTMLRDIAHAEATRYYKAEDTNPPSIIARSVFMIIVGTVTVQFIRAGVTEDRLSSLDGLVDEIANEMRVVGWNLEGLHEYANTGG